MWFQPLTHFSRGCARWQLAFLAAFGVSSPTPLASRPSHAKLASKLPQEGPLKLFQIPARQDNYIYLALGHENEAFVVDPSDAEPVINFLRVHPQIKLKAIVNTHHHHDHVGGNEDLKQAYDLPIYGPAHDADRIPGITHKVYIDDELEVCGIPMRVHDVRAHTRGHICFQTLVPFSEVYRHGHAGVKTCVPALGNKPLLFVGDSLFLGGCGRLFEGTPEELFEVMNTYKRFSGVHLVVCAHEYTKNNLEFAQWAMPKNPKIAARLSALEEEKGPAQSSVPDTLAKEFQTNPFLLALDPSYGHTFRPTFSQANPTALLGDLRSAKDRF